MRLASVAVLVFLGVASLACGGMGGGGGGVGYGLPEVDMTTPWTDMNLPIESGKCFSSNEQAVSFQYDGSKEEHFGRYTKFFESNGWESVVTDTSGPTLSAVYRKDADQVAIAAVEVIGKVTITLAITHL